VLVLVIEECKFVKLLQYGFEDEDESEYENG